VLLEKRQPRSPNPSPSPTTRRSARFCLSEQGLRWRHGAFISCSTLPSGQFGEFRPRRIGVSRVRAYHGTVRRPLPLDYDHNPDRFRTGRAVVHEFGLAGDLHTPIAARLLRETGGRALDMGCGDGVLGRLLLGSALRWIGIDLSLTLLSDAPRSAVLGDAACLPFSSDKFAAVAALFMLYHLGEPGPYLRLPDSTGLRRYLIGRGVDPSVAAIQAEQPSFPLTITKRGALLFGRKS